MLFNLSISTYHRSEWKINLQFAVSKVIYGRTGFVTCVKGLEAMYLLGFYLSGRRDLNSRPPAPKVKPNINTTSTNIKPTSKYKGFQYLQLMVNSRCFQSSCVPVVSLRVNPVVPVRQSETMWFDFHWVVTKVTFLKWVCFFQDRDKRDILGVWVFLLFVSVTVTSVTSVTVCYMCGGASGARGLVIY